MKSIRLQQNSYDKPLLLMFPWLFAKPKHTEKFCSLYTDVLGFDILLVHVNLNQLLLPAIGSQLIALDVLKFLSNNDNYDQILIHGFSVGGYMFGECLVQMNADSVKYAPVINRIKSQVWDSLTGRKEIPIAFGKNFFPQNQKMQENVRKITTFYNSFFYNVATKHYIRSEDYFHFNALQVPALMFYSDTDVIGTKEKNETIANDFESRNIVVTRKCFEASPHVSHYQHHREEYVDCLMNHLASCNLLSKSNYSTNQQ